MGKEQFFYAVCHYCGLIKLNQWWRQHLRPGLIILNYHRASGGDLRRHLLYLRQHYRIMHLEEALEELYTTGKWGKQIRDRRTPMVLTFDDGYRDLYTHAFPIVCELQVPITLFIIPGYIGSGNCFWWEAGDLFVEQAQVDKVTIEGCTYHLGQHEERKALAQVIYARTRHSRSVAEREAFLTLVREELAIPSLILPEEEAVLNWAEIREMEESGWVSFGAHTMHHPVLAYLKDAVEVRCEVSECRTKIEQQLGHSVCTFAYPIGKAEHIGEEALQAVREAGYDWAVTTIYGINTARSDPRQLRRIETDVTRHWLFLAAETSGIRKWILALIKSLQRARGMRVSKLKADIAEAMLSSPQNEV